MRLLKTATVSCWPPANMRGASFVRLMPAKYAQALVSGNLGDVRPHRPAQDRGHACLDDQRAGPDDLSQAWARQAAIDGHDSMLEFASAKARQIGGAEDGGNDVRKPSLFQHRIGDVGHGGYGGASTASDRSQPAFARRSRIAGGPPRRSPPEVVARPFEEQPGQDPQGPLT